MQQLQHKAEVLLVEQIFQHGRYTICETSVPAGYLLNPNPKNVTLSYQDENTEVVFESVTIANQEPTGSISVIKTNTNGDRVEGATFEITAINDIYNVARTVKYYSRGQKVAEITTSKDGVAIKNNLPLRSISSN